MFCVYLTTYGGNKLPPFYIGSSTLEKVQNGYHGSVVSKKYSSIWKAELKANSHLFKTKVVSIYASRKAALEAECRLQIKLKVVRSEMYINQAIAAKNGFWGDGGKGIQNPKKARAGEKNGMFGRTRTEDERRRMSEGRAKRTSKQNLRSYSRVKGDEERRKLSEAQKKYQANAGNNRARRWIVTSPTNEVFNLHGNFKSWCLEHHLPSGSPVLRLDGTVMSIGKWAGWKVERL